MKTFLLKLLIMPVSTVLGLQAATQYTAAAFGYHSALGAPLLHLHGWRLYAFWRFPVWLWRYGQNHPVIFNYAWFTMLLVLGLGLVAVCLVRWRLHPAPAPTTYGSAAWATEDDVQRSGLL